MVQISAIGNGEKQYENTRHNAGYIGLDALKQILQYEGFIEQELIFRYDKDLQSDICKVRWGGDVVIILQKTKGFMNTSGELVDKLSKRYIIEHFILFHDDLDLKLGEYKIQRDKSPKGHNGVISVENALQYTDFVRVRLGIENRKNKNIPGDTYVLERFNKDELDILKAACIKACEELVTMDIFQDWI